MNNTVKQQVLNLKLPTLDMSECVTCQPLPYFVVPNTDILLAGEEGKPYLCNLFFDR